MTMCTCNTVYGTHTYTQEHFYCVFKNNEDIFLQHYFWYTLLLIETRSLAVHDDFLTFDNCAQPNTQS